MKDYGNKKPSIDAKRAVWLGGIPAGTTFQALLDLGRHAGDALYAQCLKNDTAVIGFRTEQGAEQAAIDLDGAKIGKIAIQAGPWERKAPSGGHTSNDRWGGHKTKKTMPLKEDFRGKSENGGRWGSAGKPEKGSIDAPKAVWIGGVPRGATYHELLELGKQAGNAVYAACLKSGNAVIGYSSKEEAMKAASMLDGSTIGDAFIEAGPWERKAPSKGWRPSSGRSGFKNSFASRAMNSWNGKQQHKSGDAKGRNTRNIDAKKAVWVSGVPDGTTYQELLEIGKTAGNCLYAQVLKNGTGVLGFKTAEEVDDAVEAIRGVSMGGGVLLADAWERKQRQKRA